ncbi:family 10 glycosylhydrolase [Thermoanaerobacterium sp. RBIITD]|uniref:glycoside hydrolase family 10 protein n=1 Tax=Thermoanaerobacterium sp. RBIITD TaxID=1550240 RepID=UPI000BB87E99|nr:family 10 glycosylhydrolase [Thermoanaerobacterium sp. RBIITD]SNX53590.1 Uncharacterized lipoprotein YddW, UPF0748 family [Thermoanaerobacterium sp. RBIITD]
MTYAKKTLSLILAVALLLSFNISYIFADTGTMTGTTGSNTPSGIEANTVANDVYNLPEKYFKVDEIVVPIDDVNKDRQEGSVIVYTPAYGKSTNTNQWGMEITVVNNIVTKVTKPDYINANNSDIPENGSVISIHIANPICDKLLETVKEGDKIEVVLDNFNTTTMWKVSYNAIDPKTESDNPYGYYFPGMRGPDQLIVYDSLYGKKTGTNDYGYEVVVSKDGKIISVGGNNSDIPDGGFVVSGHGKSAEWLIKYATLGSNVTIDKANKEVIIEHTPVSYIDEAEYRLNMVENNLIDAKKEFKDIPYNDIQSIIDNAKIKLNNAKNYINNGSYKDAEVVIKSLDDDINKATYMSFASEKVESRAVWIKPKEKSLEEVVKNLDMMKSININTIYLDTFWSGYTIYPTDSKYTEQNPVYEGFDVLDAYIKEAHKRGMAVYAWTENFLIGTSDVGNGGPIKEKMPEWLLISRKGDNYTLDKYGIKYYFLNPMIPDARNFLSDLYKELAAKYDIDGIQFDYMRFPNSNDYSNDFGYDDYTRELFKQYTGADPKYLDVNGDMWQLWNYFRMNIVNTFAYSVISELRTIKPGLKIAADVWPNYSTATSDIFQDSKDWTVKNYIDTLNPMSYNTTVSLVAADLKNTLDFANGHSDVVPGIGTSIGTDNVTLLKQIEAIRDNSASGVGLFEFESLFKKGYDAALKSGVFSTPAVIPDKDPVVATTTILNDILTNIDGIYVKFGGMTQNQAYSYKNLIGGIANTAKSSMTIENAKNIVNSIDNAVNTINSDKSLNANVASKLTNDLGRCKNILGSFLANEEFRSNHVIDDIKVEIPSIDLNKGNILPIKVKASFSDNKLDNIYLDPSQYDISSDNTAVAEVSNGALKINGIGKANIRVNIKGNLNIKPGTNTKFSFSVDTNSLNQTATALNGRLKAVDSDGSGILLDWSGSIVNSNIAGYIVVRNDEEIARVNKTNYKDMTYTPGESYDYKIEAFDASGKILDTSNVINVKTKLDKGKNNYIYLSGTTSVYGNIALYRVDEAKSLDIIKNAGNDLAINLSGDENSLSEEVVVPVSVLNAIKTAQRNLIIETGDVKIAFSKDLLNLNDTYGDVSIKIIDKGAAQKTGNLTPVSDIYDITVTKNGQDVNIPISVAINSKGSTDPRKVGTYKYNEATGKWEYINAI